MVFQAQKMEKETVPSGDDDSHALAPGEHGGAGSRLTPRSGTRRALKLHGKLSDGAEFWVVQLQVSGDAGRGYAETEKFRRWEFAREI